jgi:hypothetical protein
MVLVMARHEQQGAKLRLPFPAPDDEVFIARLAATAARQAQEARRPVASAGVRIGSAVAVVALVAGGAAYATNLLDVPSFIPEPRQPTTSQGVNPTDPEGSGSSRDGQPGKTGEPKDVRSPSSTSTQSASDEATAPSTSAPGATDPTSPAPTASDSDDPGSNNTGGPAEPNPTPSASPGNNGGGGKNKDRTQNAAPNTGQTGSTSNSSGANSTTANSTNPSNAANGKANHTTR